MALISVIVPIYNMEKLMRKCLDSILAQTFDNYECLLIDDGSTDGSPAICDEYAAKDARFKAYHKPNGGLSDARNFGLAHAQGEYTIFFDPDDWVDKDCLKEMYAKAAETGADMVFCDYFNEDIYRRQYSKQIPTSLNHEDLLKDVLIGKIFGYTWNKLLKRGLYSQYQLEYPKDIYGCEDQYTMCSLLKHDIKIAYLPKAYYHYMHYDNSSQSRKYDEGTYNITVRILHFYDELLKGTSVHQKAVKIKKYEIVASAFFYGFEVYSSALFKKRFFSYKYIIKECKIPLFYKLLLIFSCNGFYVPSYYCFYTLFNLKQLFKKIRYGLYKKNL